MIGCTARDCHVDRGLNRNGAGLLFSLSVVHVLLTFSFLVILCVVNVLFVQFGDVCCNVSHTEDRFQMDSP